jgi:DNA anti-recombination protein RmuC
VSGAPSRAALAALVALVALGGAFVLALYALTDHADRPALLAKLVPALAAVVAAVPAFLAWLSSGRLRREHAETQAAVQTVVHQTNGNLDARLHAANNQLREELLTALGQQRRRTADEPAAS